jgi:hypothetical protein
VEYISVRVKGSGVVGFEMEVNMRRDLSLLKRVDEGVVVGEEMEEALVGVEGWREGGRRQAATSRRQISIEVEDLGLLGEGIFE